MTFDWTCTHCGFFNKADSMVTEKICSNCGRKKRRDRLPEENDEQPRGFY